MLSRAASVARTTLPCGSWARTPNQMASGAYHTSTSVESSAGRPSTGRYCEKPTKRGARRHTGSCGKPPDGGAPLIRGGVTGSLVFPTDDVGRGADGPPARRNQG